MFNGKMVSPNNEWKYLLRVLAIAGLVVFVIYKLWFSWWVPGNTESVKTESDSIGFTEKDISYIEVDSTIIIDKDTKDVLSCDGDIPNSCVHTDLNCSNIDTFNLWLRPKENVKRCQSVTATKEEYIAKNRNNTVIPICVDGQRLWFTPSTKQYECK